MRAVLIDDERPALDELSYLLKENSVEVIGTFQNTEGALDFIVQEKPDVVFLDIELREKNGIDFGVELQNSVESTAIIFVTAYPEYALEAFRAYPLDYITKPVNEERLARTLRHVREVRARRKDDQCGCFYIRCFGGLEIICGGEKVRLPTKKTRELLTYLLCNEGAMIYRDELARLMFDSGDVGKNANNLRVTLFRIKNALHEAGIRKDQLLIQEDLSTCISDGVCDIVDFQRFIRDNLKIDADNIIRAEKIAGLVNGELFIDIDALWVTKKREWVMVQIEDLLINMSIFYLSGGYTEKAEITLLRLITLNPLSDQGYHRLLDLYIRTENILKYRSCYERYREMAEKEFIEYPPKYYIDFYENCTIIIK